MVRVAVGGTFDFLHIGHMALLSRACGLAEGGELVIGITSNRLASSKGVDIADFSVRCRAVLGFVSRFNTKVSVVSLDEPFGPALTGDFDYIVVSPETFSVVVVLNERRRMMGLPAIEVVCVDYVLAWDGRPVSSSRIRSGEIDLFGNPSNL